MTLSDMKYHLGIALMILIGSLHVILFSNNDQYDVYWFYDHERYLTNILFDISCLFNFTVLTYWLSRFKRKTFQPLFIISLLSWLCYFLFYKQGASLILIPLYLCLVVKYNKKKFLP